MSNQRKPNRNGNVAVTPPAKRRVSSTAIFALAAVLVASVGAWWWAWKHVGASTSASPTTEAKTSNRPAIESDFQNLKGRWRRPDGGYVVDVKAVDKTGKMDASYFNPRPINVHKAEASLDRAATKVFIELRDVNYPGSTYNLIYEPRRDQLRGIYYQAALQQSFEVIFERMR